MPKYFHDYIGEDWCNPNPSLQALNEESRDPDEWVNCWQKKLTPMQLRLLREQEKRENRIREDTAGVRYVIGKLVRIFIKVKPLLVDGNGVSTTFFVPDDYCEDSNNTEPTLIFDDGIPDAIILGDNEQGDEETEDANDNERVLHL